MTMLWEEVWRAVDSIPGWLSEEEARTLHDLARAVEPELHVVELGAFMGRSTAALASGLRDHEDRPRGFVISVDTWVGTKDSSDESLHRQMMADCGAADLYALHRSNLGRLGLNPFVRRIRGRTAVEAIEWAREWRLEAGLLFIDARHDYEAVRADFDAWAPLVASGGFIAFHDSAAPGPARVIAEIQGDCELPIFGKFPTVGSLTVFEVE